jgi:hypothetical protein
MEKQDIERVLQEEHGKVEKPGKRRHSSQLPVPVDQGWAVQSLEQLSEFQTAICEDKVQFEKHSRNRPLLNSR